MNRRTFLQLAVAALSATILFNGNAADYPTNPITMMAKVLADPATQQALTAQGVELGTATPGQFAALLQEDIVRWARIVKASGATVD